MGGIEAVQGFVRITQASDIELLIWQLPFSWMLIAQQNSGGLFGDFHAAFDNFIQSGQVWALLLGFVLGYLFRSLTTY
jgi:hypothetical protein